jgi:hypothetical protein
LAIISRIGLRQRTRTCPAPELKPHRS